MVRKLKSSTTTKWKCMVKKLLGREKNRGKKDKGHKGGKGWWQQTTSTGGSANSKFTGNGIYERVRVKAFCYA